ncbi:MAG: aminotransferase class V-fold PLP-dependent enzyme [Robiginitomaculum sp.]|nr:aminotransferase class V-fold PLP-dependent enzyme [Robiginitomaculum sp.]MDQ7077636.1 aminotransferase class V-fold PLP-dependent enzyme [Robiginitomaculum sp.]
MTKNTQNISRRSALKGAAILGTAAFIPAGVHGKDAKETNTVMDLTQDEKYWAEIAMDFDVTPDVINLENGYWGLMSRPVLEKYIANTRAVNRNNSYYARRGYKEDFPAILRRIERELGARRGEIVLTRNATEALQGLINGYDRLKPGEAVMYADLDYYSMIAAMDTLAARQSCEVVRLNIPEPVDYDGILEFYRAALADHPKVRLLLLTQIGHRTGLQIPVREITKMARAAGVDVIVDAAHSYGQLDVKIDDIGADFIGFNLHKWIGAPLGVGAMYIRENRLGDIAPNPSAAPSEKDGIEGRVHTGTTNFAAVMTIPDAFDYHARIGAGHKEARLRYLRDVWVEAVRDIENLRVLTGNDPRLHGGITSFRFDGKTSVAENKAIVERLLKDHGIFTVHRDGVANGACVRVTPSIYNSVDDVQQLARALRALSTQM